MHTFDSALDDPDVTVIDRCDNEGGYLINVGNFHEAILIQLGRFIGNEGTRYWLSHKMITPLMRHPHFTMRPYGNYPAEALHLAVSELTDYYREAISEGHRPHDSWLWRYDLVRDCPPPSEPAPMPDHFYKFMFPDGPKKPRK